MIGRLLLRPDWRTAALVSAAGLAALLVATAFFDSKAIAVGWLVGFAFWSQILVGSLTLIMIHRLTGGRWGPLLAPAVEPAAAMLPLLLVLAVPLFIALPTLYPWLQRPPTIKPDVLSYYLNTPSFILRSAIALIGWSIFAVLLPRAADRSGQLIAALGLVFHALVVSSTSVDWYLSLEAPFNSSSFGATIAIASLVTALAWAALVLPIPTEDPALADLGGLLLATLLGITYMNFMTILVIWYGDLPAEEIWFVERNEFPWWLFAWAAFVLASLIPIFALMLSKVRSSRRPLRAIGGCVLTGMAAFNLYLIAPAAGARAILPAVLSILGIGLMLIGVGLSGATDVVVSREPADAR
jgi:hypothetical protein